MKNKLFSFAIDKENIIIYEERVIGTKDILVILTIEEALELKETINTSLWDWVLTNKKSIDHHKSAEKKP